MLTTTELFSAASVIISAIALFKSEKAISMVKRSSISLNNVHANNNGGNGIQIDEE